MQGIDLILHERDERRNHNGKTVQKNSRELVTKRLPRAGRKDGQCVASLKEDFDHAPLPFPKASVAEVVLQSPLQIPVVQHEKELNPIIPRLQTLDPAN